MGKYRVGVIGCGDNTKKKGPMGYAMAWAHAEAYEKLSEQCEIVACADIVEKNARAFADRFGVKNIYSDYKKMLAEENLDIVSICVWMALHAQMTIDAAEAGVKAIHCEKPMATTWGDAKRMAQVCNELGVQLTFNHQRRFGAPFVIAKEMLKAGEIGEAQILQYGCGNLFDTGTHFIDMLSFFNDETPAKWVIAQIDYRKPNLVFGADHEGQVWAAWEYENGVMGMAASGPGSPIIGAMDRIVGTKGVIEVGVSSMNKLPLRIKRDGQTEWEVIDTKGESIHGPGFIDRAVADIVDALTTGRESQLCARRALIATEIIFACWESSRRRGRVDLPLDVDGNALDEMIKAGQIG
ncbi:gfo/Idh/MocA family oxidoreductase [Candidatus Poribacteria bacterium]|nr:gfo/Idh/MocA family oxidoreductase [Candidatus Poribacteria bacterium]